MSLENFPSFLLNFSEGEMRGEEKHFYQFNSFRLDVGERQLLHNEDAIALTPKAFDVLVVLVKNSGHLVEKEELLRLVWSDSFVEEANISRLVHTLRKALGEDENGNKFIETVAKKGYRFVAEVEEVREPITQKSANSAPDSPILIEKLPENEAQIPPIITNQTIAPLVSKSKQRSRMILFTLGFVSAISLIFLLSFNRQTKSSFNPNEVKSIAVLPLKSLDGNNREPIYEFGIAQSLILKLKSEKNLVIRSLSATQDYLDDKKDAVVIGKEQKVDFVLSSTYQIADGKIRVTSELINVANGAVEEVFRDEQTISTSFATEDAVTANIGQALLKKLNRAPNNLVAKRHTNNDEAYRLYLLGKALTAKRNRKDAEKAIEYLEQAVKLDPNFALAYAQLAGAYSALSLFGSDKIENRLKQKAAIEKALAIDENLAEAHATLGEMKMNYEWDFEGAEKSIKKAIELDPNVGHVIYSVFLSSMGRHDEAIAEAKIAIDLDPASVLNHKNYGQFLFFARRYDEAIVQLERTFEMDKSFRTTYGWLVASYRRKGQDDKAFECFLRAPHRKDENPEKIQLWKEIYAQSGWRGITQKQLEDALEEKTGKPQWNLSGLYAQLGDNEQAIAALQEAFKENRRGWGWTTLNIDPKYDSIRSDPRFEAIVKKVGLK